MQFRIKLVDFNIAITSEINLCDVLVVKKKKDSLFIFNLWHFNYGVSWSGPLGIHLVWDSVLPGLACLFPSPN